MFVRALAVAVPVALVCTACAQEKVGPRSTPAKHAAKVVPVPSGEGAALQAPDNALSQEALNLRRISAGQARTLDRQLRRCLTQIEGEPRRTAAVGRFRTCAFRQLVHSGVSQRFNAMLAVTLTRRLRGGTCRSSLLALAGIARILGEEADAVWRELISTPRWSARERGAVLALGGLARSLARLNPRTWRRNCAPARQFVG